MIQNEHHGDVYIDGRWKAASGDTSLNVNNPATERSIGSIRSASLADVDDAARSARGAFDEWSRISVDDRVRVLTAVLEQFEARLPEIGRAISLEIGAPVRLAHGPQVRSGVTHFSNAIRILETFAFESDLGPTRMLKEPIGVAGMITPWNWPIHQIVSKVAFALAAGCTMILKPSEIAPFNAVLFAEALDAAGVPPGVFNLVHGEGEPIGRALAAHPDIDLISFTGSTRAGVAVAQAAAPSVKRVSQELGGKSPNILLDDVDLVAAVTAGVKGCFSNSGQSCNAPTRLLVPESLHAEASSIAAEVARSFVTGDPSSEDTDLGPVVSATQFDRVQSLIEAGMVDGAQLVAGGLGRPAGLDTGWFVKPTVFAGVTGDMAIARQEVFGPVLSILPYTDADQAVAMANDTEYGLAAYVSSGDLDRAQSVARRLRAGQVTINGGTHDGNVPFGGYKRSGNGRERGEAGLNEYLEHKAMIGYSPIETPLRGK